MGNTQSDNQQDKEEPFTIGTLSIIIPALNEGSNLPHCIQSVQSAGIPVGLQVLVVDGGSEDNTVKVAQDLNCEVLQTSRGRGIQLNQGFKASVGDWLMFLHADTVLPEQYGVHMQHTLQQYRRAKQAEPVWGCFRTIQAELGAPSWQQWLHSNAIALRTRMLSMPYGDQAVFVRRETLEQLGGIKEWPLLEDVDLSSRLRAVSAPAIVPHAVVTSGRRWQRLGFWQTTVINQIVLVGFALGWDVNSLAQFYTNAGKHIPTKP